MGKVLVSKSKAVRSGLKKRKQPIPSAPAKTRRTEKQQEAEIHASKPDEGMAGVTVHVTSTNGGTEAPETIVLAQDTRKVPLPFLLPLAFMNMWLHAIAPKGVRAT